MTTPASAFKARYVFPVTGPPIPGGIVRIAGGRIVAVSANGAGPPPVDLGNVAILPGLVNAHTHLEFSDLARPLGTAGNPLPNWIGRVVAHRRAAGERSVDYRPGGLAEIARGGATSVGEIATQPWPDPAADSPPADVTVFWEVLGLTPAQFDERIGAVKTHFERVWPAWAGAQPGLSPHAPYSVHPVLLARALQRAIAAGVPVAMHLAESREELELLADGAGPFRRMLEELGVWSPEVFSGGRRPLDYLKLLADAPRALVIHGNYLNREETDFLAANRARMSLVYCPRTHAYFAHKRYPLASRLERGVNVALGTDSRASNPDLSLLAEMRFVARSHANVPPDKVLEMATLAGARALGTSKETGSLEVGKLANLAVVALKDDATTDPHELLFDSNLPVVATWHRGRAV
jgi:aminodeoxyfutalosine deaminase